MIHITVGRDLDRPAAVIPVSSLGRLCCGPLRLLSWLEAQLGLSLPEVSFTARMVQYLACLEEAAPRRFYERSLRQDAFGTARTLLQWRDLCYESGWNGSAFSVDPLPRLVDLAAVEQIARSVVALNTGQRVQRCIDALAAVPLELDLTILDPPEAFARCWRDLFARLGAEYEPIAPEPAAADPGSDLARLQRALARVHTPGRKESLAGDGSFIVLRDGSPQLSAPWVARFAHAHNNADADVAILAGNHGATLDDALADAGYPRLGLTETSYWRPVFQVLPLVLELLWRPLDPSVLLQFLTHPMAPLRARIRRPLAEVVARRPGIGSEAWVEALEAALDSAVADAPETERDAQRLRLRADVDYWLECERFDAQAGAPIGVLLERVRRVSHWLAAAFAAMPEDEPEARLYAAALGHADELVRTLERLEVRATRTLPRIAMRRLVEAVRGAGTALPGRPWQCAAGEPQLVRAETPAGFTQAVETVIWWACDDEPLPRQHPWSRAERAALEANGVELQALEAQLAWQAGVWLRPVLAAKRRLVLVLHDNADGHHPIFDQIIAVAEGWAETRVDALMREPRSIAGAAPLPDTTVIAPSRLPPKSRWWRLPAGVRLPPRESESFSSLEKFLFGPYRWVLQYEARIRPGALESIDDGALLRGNLAHTLFERFFVSHDEIAAVDPIEAARWARRAAETLIEREGAVLMTPGRQAEKEQFTATAADALAALVRHLQSARVTSVAMETPLSGRFAGGGLDGTVDLIARKADGTTAVLDLKWGGFDYRRRLLVDSSYLQLAVYAQLLFQQERKWPALGYFVIREGRLAMLDSHFFPDATVERPDNGENLLEFWQRVEATWQWRRAQLDAGLVEVSAADTQPTADSLPGDDGLPLPETFASFDDHWALAGWRGDE